MLSGILWTKWGDSVKSEESIRFFNNIAMGSPLDHIVSKEEWENRVRWRDLTDEEQRIICDGGCGINILGFKVIPDFIFKPHCCRHDFGSIRGGDEWVRILVDTGFARGVMDSAMHDPKTKPSYPRIARLYINFVFAIHPKFFDYGPMKTMDEIKEFIAKEKERIKERENRKWWEIWKR
jgi:hypothetical protein